MEQLINIAIDGPAGAGKSTVAREVASRLGFVYIDTGAMYRALTYEALRHQADVHNEEAVMNLLKQMQITLGSEADTGLVLVNGKDVTEEIRFSEVTGNVSYIARHEQVRMEMVRKQQELAKANRTVMDGRDIGTAVLPEAEVKIFLTASVEERARRRHEEQLQKGMPSDYESLITEIAERDRIDSEREVAPLRKAEDAIEVDSTNMTAEEVIESILEIVGKKAS
ncbi:cytidylate kinase [Alteribacter lacisalsi]|jgi:CMP/dCMP kinase|uniref:Cytidylate kinase n=1 Tax=Alteribacter lacisalsi TaxID=2045244 RepID=A0A2W0H9C4_9BACI|nr:(d)CMP kinase [Alteribacter lacisalsi]PYZ98443.1 cytidylate kinase [Alteribacter lacisalsi]